MQQEPWPQGTYSNQTAVSSCLVWHAGYQWTSKATTTPQLCPAGSYKNEDANLIFCQLYPQGTWSNMTGLTDINQCIDCIPGIACIIEGMTSLSQAIDCPEGYIWNSYKTTSFTMFNNPGQQDTIEERKQQKWVNTIYEIGNSIVLLHWRAQEELKINVLLDISDL